MNLVKLRLVIFVMLAVGAARGAAAQYMPIDLGTIGGDISSAGSREQQRSSGRYQPHRREH